MSTKAAKKPADLLVMGAAVEVTDGGKITVPRGVTLKEAVDVLRREISYEEEAVDLREEIPGALWDAARATYRAMAQIFGWVHAQKWTRATEYSIPVAVGKTEMVPWGSFEVPGIVGSFSFMSRQDRSGRQAFGLSANVLRKFEPKVREVAALARKLVIAESLYKGKAIRVKFIDEDGDRVEMVQPEFMDVSKADERNLILSEKVGRAVATSVFTPIKYSEACKAHGIPLKRGVLLSGTYGTGKTLTAYVAANLCEQTGRTFIYVETAAELAEAIRFSADYQPALIFCEDIDREMGGRRTASTDEVLNILDGIESKRSDLMVILTTNNVGAIDRAMIRPGRLDDVIEFTAPDASAVERLIRLYGGESLAPDADLAGVAAVLAGNIPAVIRECVERAKLSQVKLCGGVTHGVLVISDAALLDAADTMAHQLGLLVEAAGTVTANEAAGRLLGVISSGGGELPTKLLLG